MHRTFYLSLLLLWGCPGSQTPVPLAGNDAGASLDQNVSMSDAGHTSQTVIEPDAGLPTPPASSPDAGVSEVPLEEVNCGAVNGNSFNLVSADGAQLPGFEPSNVGGMSVQRIGTATRQEVGAFFETVPRAGDTLTYRWICDDHGLSFDFVDVPNASGELDGEPDNSDILSRIVVDASSSLTFLGSEIHALTPQALQDGIAGLTNSLDPTSYVLHTIPDTIQMVVYPSHGFSYLISLTDTTTDTADIVMDGTLISLTFFKPQENDNWGASMNLTAPSMTLNGQTITTSSGLTGGSDFTLVTQIVGDAYDVKGSIEGDDFMLNIVTYASLGLRFVEGCGENPAYPLFGDPFICSEKVTAIVISSPFMGTDANTGLRLGSSKAEVEGAFGVGALRIDEDSGGEVYVYGDSEPLLGIIYAEGSDGVERVGAFILNYLDET